MAVSHLWVKQAVRHRQASIDDELGTCDEGGGSRRKQDSRPDKFPWISPSARWCTAAHLFVVAPNGSGAVRDLTPGVRYDIPPGPFGGSEGYAFSPDGSELTYTAKDAGRADAWSTDLNLYVVPASGAVAPRVQNEAPRRRQRNSEDGEAQC